MPVSALATERGRTARLSRRAAIDQGVAAGASALAFCKRISASATSFQPSDSLTDQQKAVRENIDRFRAASPEALLAFMAVKTQVSVRDRPTIDAPLEYVSTPDGPDNYYLARSDDPSSAFPCLSPIVPVVSREDSGVRARGCDLRDRVPRYPACAAITQRADGDDVRRRPFAARSHPRATMLVGLPIYS
jgi:hypothetical protein